MDFSERTEELWDKIQKLDSEEYQLMTQDLAHWAKVLKRDNDDAFFPYAFISRQEFRSVILYRARAMNDTYKNNSILQYLHSKWSAPNFVTNLFLSTKNIGPGLYLEHAFSTIIYAKSIGRNFYVNQNVTVGATARGIPEIGDDVQIRTGAIVIGGIKIGDGCRIGAGAIVTQDIPEGATVIAAKSTVLLK